MEVKSTWASDLEGVFKSLEKQDPSSPYSVAWVDAMSRGKSLGRGIAYFGKHLESLTSEPPPQEGLSITLPLSAPWPSLPGLLCRAFQSLVWIRRKSHSLKRDSLWSYFYPLDRIRHWNLAHGHRGFFQYQAVFPDPHGLKGVRGMLEMMGKHSQPVSLAVLKRCGWDRSGLSFCRPGYTLAVDLPNGGNTTEECMRRLDSWVLECGGRVYLAKDARMPRDIFRAMYPEWKVFMDSVRQYNPDGKMRSRQSERLGLWEN
jgi:hypothetical protein